MTRRSWILHKSSQSEHLTNYYGSNRFRVLMLATLVSVFAIVVVITWIGLQHNKEKIVSDIENSLLTVLAATVGRLDIWVNERMGAAAQFGHDPELGFIATRLLGIPAQNKELIESGAVTFAREFLQKNRNRIPGGEEIFILNRDYINIVAPRDADVGRLNLIAVYDRELLKQVFNGKGVFILPFRSGIDPKNASKVNSHTKQIAMFVVAPIVTYGDVIAAVAIKLDPAKGFSQVMQFSRVGTSGESYAFDQRGLLLSESRFEHQLRQVGLIKPGQASILNIEIRDPGVNMLEGGPSKASLSERPMTLMAESAIRAASAVEKKKSPNSARKYFVNVEGYRDYRGVPVMGAWIWHNRLHLGLATEIDKEEALSGYFTLRRTIASVLGVTLILTIGTTLFTLFLGQRAAQISNKARDELEQRVVERTTELDIALRTQERQNILLADQNEERARIQGELQQAYDVIKVQNERMESELNVGREIQKSMVPLIFPAFPEHDEFTVFAVLEPAREVGGDFYDFFFVDEDRFCICIGDVSGKGVPSALFMAVAKTLIKSRATDDISTASILTHVNDELSEDNKECMFVTLFIAIVNIMSGEAVYTSAGHNPPYVLPKNGDAFPLTGKHGPVVGAMEGMVYDEDRLKLNPADILFLYTDGVTEAVDSENKLFSDERLSNLLRASNADNIENVVNTIVAEVKAFESGAAQTDDITVLAFQYHGSSETTEMAKLYITIKNQLSEIIRVNEAFDAFAEKNGIPAPVATKFNIIFDELLNNVISYAYRDQNEHEITTRIEFVRDRLTVTIADDGVPFNPLNAKAPDTKSTLEDRELGGLGIHLVRNMVDNVFYHRQIDKNVLTLVKHLNVGAPGSI